MMRWICWAMVLVWSMAQPPTECRAQGSVFILRPLAFGVITPHPSAGTVVTIDASSGDAAPSVPPHGGLVNGGHAAWLRLSGFPGNPQISFGPNSFILTGPGGHTISLHRLTELSETDPAANGAPDDVYIGGELVAGGGIVPGNYSGVVQVTVTN